MAPPAEQPSQPSEASAPGVPVPFRISIPDSEVARLRRKLEDSELPEHDIVPDAGWDYGLSLETIRELKRAWLEEYDWRAAEAEMNSWNHYKVTIEGISLHYIHQRSAHPSAIPLVLIHGWPGSFYEFHRVLGPLTAPPAGQQAFHVVVPSVPGFGFSQAPQRKGWTVRDTARVVDTLMGDVLGYESYASQGGDWGFFISSMLALHHHTRCKAIHCNMCVSPPPLPVPLYGLLYVLPSFLRTPLTNYLFTPPERAAFARSWSFLVHGFSHFPCAGFQPALIGYALYDSPAGLLSWIGEKYTSPGLNDAQHPVPRADVLTTLALYYFSRSVHTSCLPYRENAGAFARPAEHMNDCLVGVSQFKYDIFAVPQRWIRRYHKGAVWFGTHDQGGHFPALDSPELLVQDLREYLGAHASAFTTGQVNHTM